MPSKRKHCPFLNRADQRCSQAFSLDNLDHMFRYCFGRYQACNIYVEMLIERRARRSLPELADLPQHHHAQHLFQLSVRRSKTDADAQRSTAGSGVSVVPGVGARAGR
jgi:hypothetical protein